MKDDDKGSTSPASAGASSFARRREHASGPGRGRRPDAGTPRNPGHGEKEGRGRSPRSETSRPGGAERALVELDRDLMKLLARRGSLVSRLRDGKDYAGTPDAVRAEKAVRLAWEEAALAFSKDPRFSRELFTLLQDIRMLTREEAEERGAFHLAPASRSVSGTLSGITSLRTPLMWMTLAASLGQPISLRGALLSNAAAQMCKALTHMGVTVSQHASRPGSSDISLGQGKPLVFRDAAIHVGDDPLALYLFAFAAAGSVGTCRFTGGSAMKAAELSGLRHTLPLLGARFVHVVPRSHGLPALAECSGMLPEEVAVPAELPLDGVCALLVAPLIWNVPVVLELGALPAAMAAAALAEVTPLHRETGACVEVTGSRLRFVPGPLCIPREPVLPLSPVLSSFLLALPALGGGDVTLRGQWPAHLPQAVQAQALLAWAGVTLEITPESARASSPGIRAGIPEQVMPSVELGAELAPLFFALAAARVRTTPLPLPELLTFEDDATLAVAEDFLARLGMKLEENVIMGGEPQKSTWVTPTPFWGMALALAACMFPGLRLANPGVVTSVFPSFWPLYNALPVLADPVPGKRHGEETPHDAPARRRIIAD